MEIVLCILKKLLLCTFSKKTILNFEETWTVMNIERDICVKLDIDVVLLGDFDVVWNICLSYRNKRMFMRFSSRKFFYPTFCLVSCTVPKISEEKRMNEDDTISDFRFSSVVNPLEISTPVYTFKHNFFLWLLWSIKTTAMLMGS